MGTLLRRCVKVRTAIELSFGVVSGVGPDIDVQNGGPHALREGWILALFAPSAQCFNGVVYNRNVFDSCMRS